MKCNHCIYLERILNMFTVDTEPEYKCLFYNIFVDPDRPSCNGEHKEIGDEL